MNLKIENMFYILSFLCSATFILVVLFNILSRRSENAHLFLCKEYLHYPTLRYHHPVNASLVGLAFQENTLKFLKKMFCHESNLYSVKSLNFSNTEHIPFVTAANDVYFQSVLVTIRSVQMHFPYARIVLYDLGLETNQSEYASKLCNVKVMKFPFDEFPEFVSTLSQFRWKPIILMLSLLEYGTLWYLDSSIILTSSNLLPVYNLINQLHPNKADTDGKCSLLFHGSSGHGIFSATNPKMYDYFPTNLEKLKNTEMFESGIIFASYSEEVYSVLFWMVACAVEGPCMAPPDSNSFCQFGRNRYRDYAFCHRYDQSAFNLLLANLLHYKSDRWSSGMSYFYLVRRNQRDETNFPVMC
ncbi:hypothetical protein T11_17671 [Trichinella zimbabwensis]|uniref:Uncharacterized protein n=1 Tax=Trichinella zimbabwensis TaxID=268475 RepID=A0A0V1HK10_9BILA|nr:hypothetical protein T11_17671 [Trichinella zimbabwensis]